MSDQLFKIIPEPRLIGTTVKWMIVNNGKIEAYCLDASQAPPQPPADSTPE